MYKILFVCISFLLLNGKVFPNTLDSLKRQLELSNGNEKKANIFIEISKVFGENEMDSNLHYKLKALELIKNDANNKWKTLLPIEITKLYTNIGNSEKAISFGTPYYQKFFKNINLSERIEMAVHLGFAHYIGGNREKSINYFNEAINLSDESITSHRKFKCNALRSRASIYADNGNFEKSIIDLENALKLANQKDYHSLGAIHYMLSTIYLDFNDRKEALNEINIALKFAKKSEDLYLLASCMYSISDYYLKEKPKKAEKYALKGLKLLEENNFLYGIIMMKSMLGAVYMELQKYDIAESNFIFIIENAPQFQLDENIANANYDLGNIEIERGNFDKSLNYCIEAWNFFKDSESYGHMTNTCECLYKSYEGLKNYEKALLYFKKNNEYSDSIRNEQKIRDSYKLQNKFELERKEAIHKLEKEQKELEVNQKLKAKNEFIVWIIILAILLLTVVFLIFRVLQRKKEAENILEREKAQTKFSQDLIQSQEEEKTRISRELHDSVGQDLILLKNKAKLSNNEELENIIGKTLDNVRSITQDLHPFVLEKFGLTAAIKKLITKVDENTSIFITDEVEEIDGVLSKNAELNIYRIIQETISNCIKHAETPSIILRGNKNNNVLFIEIIDFGIGFDWNKKSSSKNSLGLKTLQERAKIIHADLSIFSQLNKGTTITIKIPILL